MKTLTLTLHSLPSDSTATTDLGERRTNRLEYRNLVHRQLDITSQFWTNPLIVLWWPSPLCCKALIPRVALLLDFRSVNEPSRSSDSRHCDFPWVSPRYPTILRSQIWVILPICRSYDRFLRPGASPTVTQACQNEGSSRGRSSQASHYVLPHTFNSVRHTFDTLRTRRPSVSCHSSTNSTS